MKEPKQLKMDFLPINLIVEQDRLRPVSEAAVASIMTSISELGVMKDAVSVRKHHDGRFILMAGSHRLEAARRLNWAEISVKVWAEVTDDWARLMEVDDNIAGADLCPLDTAVFLAERKRIYEKMHPETRAGFAGSAARWNANDIVSFASATAEKFAMSKRNVERLVRAGSALRVHEVARLREAKRQITVKDMGDIGRIGDAAERMTVVDALAEGRAKSVGEARRVFKAEKNGIQPVIKDRVDEGFKALMAVWMRAPEAARMRFVNEHHEGLSERLKKDRRRSEGGSDA